MISCAMRVTARRTSSGPRTCLLCVTCAPAVRASQDPLHGRGVTISASVEVARLRGDWSAHRHGSAHGAQPLLDLLDRAGNYRALFVAGIGVREADVEGDRDIDEAA